MIKYILAFMLSTTALASIYEPDPSVQGEFVTSPVGGVGCFAITNNDENQKACRVRSDVILLDGQSFERVYKVAHSYALFDSFDVKDVCFDYMGNFNQESIWDEGYDPLFNHRVDLSVNHVPRVLAFCHITDDSGLGTPPIPEEIKTFKRN